MSAKDAASKVRNAIETLKTHNVKDRPLVEVLELSHQMADAMKFFFGSLDQSVTSEFKDIAEFIQKAKDEISALRPNDIRNERIPTAGAELDAIVRDTEIATETIMSGAEEVLCAEASDLDEYKAMVDAKMMDIIEACSFQDLTGQRVSKVVSTLTQIEERVTSFANALGVKDADAGEESDEEKRRRELLLNGPAKDGPATSQDDIDAMFGDADAAASQDDIDALFG